MFESEALTAADRLLLQSYIRQLRDSAIEGHRRAVMLSKRLDGTVLVLSTLTAGSLWFLCTSAGPGWLSTAAKWVGAIFATTCATLTAYKERVTNYRKLADGTLDHVRALEHMVWASEEQQTPRALKQLHAEYRKIKAELTAMLIELRMPTPITHGREAPPRPDPRDLLFPTAELAEHLYNESGSRGAFGASRAEIGSLLTKLDTTANEIAEQTDARAAKARE